MLIQGYEIRRKDFGDELRDRIAFEVAFSQNCLCGSKKALMTLLYSSADSIIEEFNREQVAWTKAETPPSAVLQCVLMRYKQITDTQFWSASLVYWHAGDELDSGEWKTFGNGPDPWPDDAEWMAIAAGDDDPNGRRDALATLGAELAAGREQLEHDELLAVIVGRLREDPLPDVRVAAARALGAAGDSQARFHLTVAATADPAASAPQAWVGGAEARPPST